MDTVTYSNDDVLATMEELFVPVKVDGSTQIEITQQYKVEVTPSALAIDGKKKIHYRQEGFLSPSDFRQTLRLMAATYHVDRRNYDTAIRLLNQILEEGFGSAPTAESLYLSGVARYKKSGDFQQAVEQWRKLKLSYPNHPLVKKVDYAL